MWPMKAGRYEEIRPEWAGMDDVLLHSVAHGPQEAGMGLAPGGRMKQEICDDPYGLDAWDQRHGSRCFVSLLNSAQWMAVTGERPPIEPPDGAGLPPPAACPGSTGMAVMRGPWPAARVSGGSGASPSTPRKTGQGVLADNETVAAAPVIALGKPRRVRESVS